MLINHWYVVAESAEVTDKPMGVHYLGQDLVVFRDAEGKARCLSDTCIHKGGSLCRGEVVQGTIECPYHGWRYDGSGDCVAIPSLPPGQRIPKRARVDAYPVVEKWGWIWAFLGDLPEGERPPLPDFFPEYEANDGANDGQWRFVRGQARFDCNWVRAIENGVDRTHAIFVHTAFGNPVNPVVGEYTVDDSNNRIYGFSLRKPLNKEGSWKNVIPDERDERKTEVQIYVPAPCIRIQMHMQPPISMFIVTAYTPIDPFHTKLHFIHSRNFLMDEAHDADTKQRVLMVIGEDAAVLNHLKPARVPPSLADELLLASDLHGTTYRRKYFEARARGWLIDHRASTAEDDCVRVIPSPRRREDPKNWVLRPVLTLAPSEGDSEGADAGEREAGSAA
jgi:phenylpropionate dioxygenase-like ring-hydroxylating dioxygenase large terminal subunit